AEDFLMSGAALQIQNNIGGGITVVNDTANARTGSITSFSTAPAILITPNSTAHNALSIGATSTGYGFLHHNNIVANAIFNGFDATAVRVDASGGGSVNIAGGIENDGGIGATAFEANATTISIGAGATVPAILNTKSIGASSTSETAKNAIAIDIAPG